MTIDRLRQYGFPITPNEIVNDIFFRFSLGGNSELGWNRFATYVGLLPIDATSTAEPSLRGVDSATVAAIQMGTDFLTRKTLEKIHQGLEEHIAYNTQRRQTIR